MIHPNNAFASDAPGRMSQDTKEKQGRKEDNKVLAQRIMDYLRLRGSPMPCTALCVAMGINPARLSSVLRQHKSKLITNDIERELYGRDRPRTVAVHKDLL